MTEFEFWVNGMTCEHCEGAVTAELAALPTVVGTHVDAVSGRVVITSSARVDRAAVERAVEDAGYTVRSWPSLSQND
ncbi:heavy-metal-associated domain-containing protein [Microbacterium profundi]|uniref:Heavy-metal-associated domain-containing protein n=1 Tax=Microbacterium profundi TaxID=450380 RepID=A0ABV3LCK7_9MICO